MSTSQINDPTTASSLALPPSATVSDDVRAAAERLGVGRYLDDVVAFTVEIFGAFSNVELVPDPEVPDWEHIVFEVPVTGSVDDLLDKDQRWSRRLLATIPKAPRVFSFDMDYQG